MKDLSRITQYNMHKDVQNYEIIKNLNKILIAITASF